MVPTLSDADSSQWGADHWQRDLSSHYNARGLNWAQKRSIDMGMQSAKRIRFSGSISPINTHEQAQSPVYPRHQDVRVVKQRASGDQRLQGAPFDPAQITPGSHWRLQQATNFHHSAEAKRAKSPANLDQSRLVAKPLSVHVVSTPNKHAFKQASEVVSSSDSANLQLKVEELTKALVSSITNGDLRTDKPGELELAVKEHVHKAFYTSIAHDVASEQTTAETPSERSGKCHKCDSCPKRFKRRCDLRYVQCSTLYALSHQRLRKHKKRHSRPYGCTFADCSKRLGSKNDWKRHENTRHYQVEAWRCHEPNPTSRINQCAKVFSRREQYQAHLRNQHKIKDEMEIRKRCQKHRIGRNGQNGFWCGFCRTIVTLTTKGLEAWDERFNHIDEQHFSKGLTIDNWYPLDKDIPIGDMLQSNGFDTDTSPSIERYRSSSEDSSEQATQDDSSSLADAEARPDQEKPSVATNSSDDRSGRTKSKERVWYCVSSSPGLTQPVLMTLVHM